jgi:hypothetical protein
MHALGGLGVLGGKFLIYFRGSEYRFSLASL